jgi:hypothetical protein
MKKMTLSRANHGLRKIPLTKLLQQEFGYSLSKAKSITDAVLENETVTLHCDDERCELLAQKLRELNVKISVDR